MTPEVAYYRRFPKPTGVKDGNLMPPLHSAVTTRKTYAEEYLLGTNWAQFGAVGVGRYGILT